MKIITSEIRSGRSFLISPRAPAFHLATATIPSSHHHCMKIATFIARVLLGLVFIVFGSNAFLHFPPMPPLPQGVAGEYLHAFFASGYVYVIGGLQVIGGLLLLIGRFVPLGLTILGAIIVNIWLFHILMAPEGLGPGIFVGVLE